MARTLLVILLSLAFTSNAFFSNPVARKSAGAPWIGGEPAQPTPRQCRITIDYNADRPRASLLTYSPGDAACMAAAEEAALVASQAIACITRDNVLCPEASKKED